MAMCCWPGRACRRSASMDTVSPSMAGPGLRQQFKPGGSERHLPRRAHHRRTPRSSSSLRIRVAQRRLRQVGWTAARLNEPRSAMATKLRGREKSIRTAPPDDADDSRIAPCFAFDSLSSRGDTGTMPRLSRRSLLAACLAAPTLAGARGHGGRRGPSRSSCPSRPAAPPIFLARLLGQSITMRLASAWWWRNGRAPVAASPRAPSPGRPDGQTLLLAHIGTLAVNPWI